MLDGVLNIYKEKDMTSHDVVNIVRRKLGIRKVGHTGTLDPMATGVLPVCIGKATKLASFITDGNKVYRVQMELGFKTDSYDITGEVLDRSEVEVSEAKVREAVLSFVGDSEQLPPMYSAIKIDGKKLYELAREGKEVKRKKRNITIFYIDKLEIKGKVISFEVACSKGTYVRSLVFDIGEKLGTFATMTELERVSVSGGYTKDNALSVSDFKAADIDEIKDRIQTLEDYFSDLEKIRISEKLNTYLYNGNKVAISPKSLSEEVKIGESLVNVYSSSDEYMGVYAYEKGFLKPRYFFNFRKEDNADN